MNVNRSRSFFLIAAVIFSLTSCGKKTDESQKSAQQNADSNQKTSQTLNGSPTPAANAKPGTVIPAKTLAAALPTIPGYTAKGTPHSFEDEFEGTKTSHADQTYRNGKKEIEVAYVDFNNIASLTRGYLSLINTDIETENSSHHPIKVGSNPGWTNWDKRTNSGMVGVYIGNRVFLTLDGSGGVTVDELKSIASGISTSSVEKEIK